MPVIELENKAVTYKGKVDDWHSGKMYRVYLLITQDEEGTYSAVALNLPGAGSCGDTEAEAVENAKESVVGLLESYRDAGADVPWRDPLSTDIPTDGGTQRVVLVHA
jgi:predicted RNase H-like HicB family nuclease